MGRLEDTSAETVSNVRSVRAGGTALAQVSATGDAARVVDTSSLVDLLGTRCAQTREDLLKSITRGGTGSTILDHTDNGAVRARVHMVASVGTNVTLHQARVGMRVGSGPNADTSLALLHDSGQNETCVNTGRTGDALNGRLNAGNLGR